MKLVCERCYNTLEYKTYDGLDGLYVDPCDCEDPDMVEEIEYLTRECDVIDDNHQTEIEWNHQLQETIKEMEATIATQDEYIESLHEEIAGEDW
jgi:hypothetical protein